MPMWAYILIAVGIVAAAAAWLYLGRKRTARLRSRMGPEYDRAVAARGSRRRAERDLERRERRAESIEVRPLVPQERERFLEAWRADQARFVDDPKTAVIHADRLVTEIMRARGYPVADFEQRAVDVAVHHPNLVENYRFAREVLTRFHRGEAGTEDLRKAMVCYRALFDELLEVQEAKR